MSKTSSATAVENDSPSSLEYVGTSDMNQDPHLEPHGSLFHRDDMITIRVDNGLFRVSRFSLTRQSSRLAILFATHPLDSPATFHLNQHEPEVTYSSFESLLLCLHPPEFGVIPISTLTQWNDVLFLSDKWQLSTIRAAAIRAIFPLASPVDKIVLGRKYGLQEWLPGAIAKLIVRHEGLNVSEGYQLGMEMAIAISNGRLDVREVTGIRPKIRVNKIAAAIAEGVSQLVSGDYEEDCKEPSASLGHKPRSKSMKSSSTMDPAENSSTESLEIDRRQEKLVVWGKDTAFTRRVFKAEKHIMEYLEQNPNHVDEALIAVLQGSLARAHFCATHERRFCELCHKAFRPSLFTNQSVYEALSRLTSPEDISERCQTWCTELIRDWNPILTIPLDPTYTAWFYAAGHDVSNFRDLPPSFWEMFKAIRLMRTLIDHCIILPDSNTLKTFVLFWTRMTELCTLLPPAPQSCNENLLGRLLVLAGTAVITDAVCDEADAFYDEIVRSPSIVAFDDLICARVWPTQIEADRLAAFSEPIVASASHQE